MTKQANSMNWYPPLEEHIILMNLLYDLYQKITSAKFNCTWTSGVGEDIAKEYLTPFFILLCTSLCNEVIFDTKGIIWLTFIEHLYILIHESSKSYRFGDKKILKAFSYTSLLKISDPSDKANLTQGHKLCKWCLEDITFKIWNSRPWS